MPRIIINDHSPQVRVASVSGPGPPAPARHAPARPCDAPACLPHAWPPVSSHVFSRMSLPVSATRSPPPPSLLASAMRCATPRPRDSSTLAATLCGTLCDSPPIGSVSCCCKLKKTLNSASSARATRVACYPTASHPWRTSTQPPQGWDRKPPDRATDPHDGRKSRAAQPAPLSAPLAPSTPNLSSPAARRIQTHMFGLSAR